MNKQKRNFHSLDITAMVRVLEEKIVGLRLANIFDINPKTYIFKFGKNERKE
jgi:predicted ribosome quality control (RQC) complex YloA/Tae2 family protein